MTRDRPCRNVGEHGYDRRHPASDHGTVQATVHRSNGTVPQDEARNAPPKRLGAAPTHRCGRHPAALPPVAFDELRADRRTNRLDAADREKAELGATVDELNQRLITAPHRRRRPRPNRSSRPSPHAEAGDEIDARARSTPRLNGSTLLDDRVTSVSTELANQLTEIGNDIEPMHDERRASRRRAGPLSDPVPPGPRRTRRTIRRPGTRLTGPSGSRPRSGAFEELDGLGDQRPRLVDLVLVRAEVALRRAPRRPRRTVRRPRRATAPHRAPCRFEVSADVVGGRRRRSVGSDPSSVGSAGCVDPIADLALEAREQQRQRLRQRRFEHGTIVVRHDHRPELGHRCASNPNSGAPTRSTAGRRSARRRPG